MPFSIGISAKRIRLFWLARQILGESVRLTLGRCAQRVCVSLNGRIGSQFNWHLVIRSARARR